METYLKCLLKCKPRVALNEKQLGLIIKMHKINGKLAGVVSKLMLHCFKAHKAESDMLYAQARVFIGYDRALEGGRDQDWWFKRANDMMAETIEYWKGRTPHRVAYELSVDDPMRFPMTYVYWQNRIALYTAKEFIVNNKYWLAAVAILGVL